MVQSLVLHACVSISLVETGQMVPRPPKKCACMRFLSVPRFGGPLLKIKVKGVSLPLIKSF